MLESAVEDAIRTMNSHGKISAIIVTDQAKDMRHFHRNVTLCGVTVSSGGKKLQGDQGQRGPWCPISSFRTEDDGE